MCSHIDLPGNTLDIFALLFLIGCQSPRAASLISVVRNLLQRMGRQILSTLLLIEWLVDFKSMSTHVQILYASMCGRLDFMAYKPFYVMWCQIIYIYIYDVMPNHIYIYIYICNAKSYIYIYIYIYIWFTNELFVGNIFKRARGHSFAHNLMVSSIVIYT